VLALGCLVSALSLSSATSRSTQLLQTQNYYIPMRVEPADFSSTLTDLETLLQFAKDKKMNQNMQMFFRGASHKVRETLASIDEMKKEAAAAKELDAKKKDSDPVVFTTVAGHKPDFNSQVGVKRLKGSGAKKSNVKKYSAEKLPKLIETGKVNWKKPFLVTGGVQELSELQRKFTALGLKDNTKARVRYLSPVKAKEKRSFDKQQQQQGQPEEQMEYQRISTEKYLVNCFNLRAKPDFRRLGGTQTEHCEMELPAAVLDPNMTDFQLAPVESIALYAPLEGAKQRFVARANELEKLAGEGVAQRLQQSSSSNFVFGPSGSGEQLRQAGGAFVDGLIHGKKRWFLMMPEDFNKLRGEAREVLEPASAFIFFEQQLEELIEDHELGSEIKYWDTNQLPGELIYIPGDLIMTSLSYSDSFSFKQLVLEGGPQVLAAKVNSKIWDPQSGQVPAGFQFAVCHGLDVAKAGEQLGTRLQPQQAGMIAQIFNQFFPGKKAQNSLILEILAECAATLDAGLQGTYCAAVYGPCVKQLEKNAKALKLDVPGWVKHSPNGKQEL